MPEAVAPQQSALLAQICYAINAGLLALDRDERVVMWNHWLEQRSDLTEASIIGLPFATAFPSLVGGRAHRAIKSALGQGMASVVSQSLNRHPFPLHVQVNRLSRQPMQQAISVVPLLCEGERYCLVQIQDVTAAVDREQELHRIALELEGHSYQDGLTGLANRRAFDRQFELELRRAVREEQPLAVALADVDYFKAYNDHYGHVAGDDCLRRVAEILSHATRRPLDMAARYGGEEFVFLLPNTDRNGASSIGSTLCREVLAARIPHMASGAAPYITVSVGIVSLVPPRGAGAETFLMLADQALYRAKQGGRNQVCVAGAEESLAVFHATA
ncbi:GGDEF domain-containing protein [Methylogaea oryzae]|uniref:diguanylate cyclase n=1 Tax=Methylogaea oryzae TaxID=1295382 RepID=A0A8D5AIK7_9GAMM|nr:GGDEF domain-containing protein [Methylogaea oryzae]BBL69839.1 hypothetical protein MoryE10_04450 [Methylogaea oryzae]